jgi:hypothetical protein
MIKDILDLEDDTQFCIALSDFVFSKDIDFTDLTQSEQIVYCVDDLEREINNGGFEQFFLNSAGDHIYQTLQALENIGAVRTLQLVQRAIKIFPDSGPSPIRDIRVKQLREINDDVKNYLNELDEEFMKYPDNLAMLIRCFVNTNQNEFVDAGQYRNA